MSTPQIYEVAYAPDGSRLAAASSIGISIRDTQTGEELNLLKGHRTEVYSVAFSPDGTTLASGSAGQTIRLWDAVTVADVSEDGVADIFDLIL